MGLADSVAIAAAERVERTGGPRAGLFAWRKLAETATSPELRGTALLAAMRCALALAEPGTFAELARLWPTVGQGMWDTRTSALCKEAARAGMLGAATELAAAEANRSGTALAIYAYARCLDVARDPRAGLVLGDAAARAEKEGALALARAARVRRVAWLARAAETRARAVDEAKAIDARDLSAGERLVIARILLGAGSRFVRATGLGLLDDVVSAGGPLARRALAIGARHADDLGEALSPMETDRLLGIFAREPVAKEAAPARDALRALEAFARAKDDASFDAALDASAKLVPELGPLHLRARRILAGASSPSVEDPSAWPSLLDAAAAMRDDKPAVAALALRRLAGARRVPAQAWSVLHGALAVDDAELREAAGALVKRLLDGAPATPPRGWLALTQALVIAGHEDLAARARRNAAIAGEPGAVEALAVSLTRAGWQLARAGDRSRAIQTLREAKALASSRGASRSP